jgi:Na+-driven multidrug efflux pump
MLSSSTFQGIGKGLNSLLVTVIRTLVFTPSLAWLFATTLNLNLEGAWWGIVAANILGAAIGFTWVKTYIRKLTLVSKQQ